MLIEYKICRKTFKSLKSLRKSADYTKSSSALHKKQYMYINYEEKQLRYEVKAVDSKNNIIKVS